ncbi:MAG: hypothetical protein JWN62_4072 [Acidimicrobiales bacterium]|nr:hypothetical protein [Acidimicrobiales bacterium]
MSALVEGLTMCPRRRAGRRRSAVAAVLGALAFGLIGCGSDSGSSGGASSPAASDQVASQSAATASPTNGSDAARSGAAVLLDVDPCTLLTPAEMEAAVGKGLERGGLGTDLPGRCTYSVGGDLGVGVVAISVQDPLVCTAVKKAVDSGADPQSKVVDVGDGGVVGQGGTIDFLLGGGCVRITASIKGRSLAPDSLVMLATAAAGRVG